MSDTLKHTRNVAIVVAIAAAVYFIPGGGRAASTVEAALITAFAIAIGYLFLRLYRERHLALYSLGDTHRGLLYGAVALAFFLWAVRKRMWYALQLQGNELAQVHRWDGFGEALWFVLAGLVVYGLLAVYRHARTY
ncbi:MAG TPA: hypothetical protein VKV16_07755 [Solirubrobacteraceae bacterium]|nr:hypothetical protein [Solirubrobacteraceae bacterium]